MALLLAVLQPLESISPVAVSSIKFSGGAPSAWCIQGVLEASMLSRFLHGLELTTSALIGTAVLFIVALLVNNIGPASRNYPSVW